MATSLPTFTSDLTLHYDGEDETIYETLRKWKQYPSNIIQYVEPRNRPRLIQQIKHHFEKIKSSALFTFDESLGPARTNAIERKIRTIWFDSSHTPEPSGTRGLESRFSRYGDKAIDYADDVPTGIKSNAQLEAYLGIFGTDSRPRPDPIWRFIILETSAPGSPRLKITDALLLRILTYHHVSPYFLEHISHICHEPPTGVSEAPFSGFRSLKSFSQFSPIPASEALGRSGFHYQLIFDLKTVVNPDGTASTISTSGDDLNLWPIIPCAIYHRFDISTGKSIWILTPPGTTSAMSGSDGDDYTAIPPWNKDKSTTTRDLLSNLGVPSPLDSSSSVTECFSASLTTMVWLADWSLSEYDSYIATLDEQMQILALPYINARDNAPIYEITLKTYNQYMETLDQVIGALESNLSILQSVMAFYTDEFLTDPDLSTLDPCPPWLQDHLSPPAAESDYPSSSSSGSSPRQASPSIPPTRTVPKVRRRPPARRSQSEAEILTSAFATSLSSVCKTYDELILRANAVKQMGTRRESTTHRLLQNRDTTAMKQLQKLTYIFSTITLLLLPMSVVSTIFSTDIVKFDFPSTNTNTPSSSAPGAGVGDGNNGAVDFRGTWSAPALVWWIVSTVLATALVGGLGERWRRKSAAALKMGEGVVPSSRIMRGSSAGGMAGGELDGDEEGRGWMGGMARTIKRGYWDLEAQGRARVQWVVGKMAIMRQRWAIRGESSKLGIATGMEMMDGRSGSLYRDPETAGGGR